MKKFITSLLILCGISVTAHEFWLQPDKFIYNKGETAIIKFRVGENFEGENWNSNRSKINFLTFYSNGSTKDVAPLISDNNGDSLQLTLANEGTAMIAYNGFNSFIALDAAKFNQYLEEDGLEDAIEYRKQYNETGDSSHELYQRSVKTILQVGKKYDDTYKQETQLPLDIIPQVNPYQLKKKQLMTVKVLFNNKPLASAMVNIWQRVNNHTLLIQRQTDEHGFSSFQVSTSGYWMVSTVKMLRLQKDPKAQWQSYWGSCTWGYE
jgi:uncharacterized GH25 family protein